MRRALSFTIAVGGCGWLALLAIYVALAVYLYSRGAVPGLAWESIVVAAAGVVCSALLPMVLSRRGRIGAAFAFACCGLAALLPAGFITYLWQPWDAPYCWICDDQPLSVLNGY
jgi:hypothetical protein